MNYNLTAGDYMNPCKKVIGSDFELANFLEAPGRGDGRVGLAAQRLLQEISGYPNRWGGSSIEFGRRFLSQNGSSAYIDSEHLEINLPEHTRAADHAAMVHAGLKIARTAQLDAQAELDDGETIRVSALVSDGQESWGHHLNVMIRRRLFNDLFHRKPHLAGFLATHLATSTLYTGQGQVGAGNLRPHASYQLSQRADWFEQLFSEQTMYRRPLLNMRDEAHAEDGLARLHIIFFDRVLCPIANYLMAGTTQLVLAMAEAGHIEPDLILDDPLAAIHEVSRDLTLSRTLAMAKRGRRWSAVDVQRGLADLAGEFAATPEAEEAVPGVAEIVSCWISTLDLLKKRDLAALARRCDWALKYLLVERERGRRNLTWDSAELKVLDFRFADLDPAEGLFWQMAAAGLIDSMPDPALVDRFVHEPPDDTRAYLRAHILRRFGPHVVNLDWSWMQFRIQTDRWWSYQTRLEMPRPDRFDRSESEPILGQAESLRDLITRLNESAELQQPAIALPQMTGVN